MDELKALLQSRLPSEATRFIASATIAGVIGAFALPEGLRMVGILVGEERAPLLRLSVAAAILIVGMLLEIILLIRHIQSQDERLRSLEAMPVVPSSKSVPPTQFQTVLKLIARYNLLQVSATPRRIAADMKVEAPNLLKDMMVYHDEGMITYQTGGRPPDLDTGFIYSPPAVEGIVFKGIEQPRRTPP